jgi:amino acid transporter
MCDQLIHPREINDTAVTNKSPNNVAFLGMMEPTKSEEKADSWTVQLDEPAPFKKNMGWMSILAAGFNVNNSWLVIAATLAISLSYGPMNSVWGLLVTTVVYICIALTLAELSSVYPTTGGQYHWTFMMAPKSINKAAVSQERQRPAYSYQLLLILVSFLIELLLRFRELALVDRNELLQCQCCDVLRLRFDHELGSDFRTEGLALFLDLPGQHPLEPRCQHIRQEAPTEILLIWLYV